jgi:AbrB family looped-hinge helix DNA binding protein
MALLKVLRAGQITLPADLRRRLRLGEGDYVEAEVVENGLLLKPVAMIERERAWDDLMAIIDEDKWIGPEPRPSPEEDEEAIFQAVEEYRERHG